MKHGSSADSSFVVEDALEAVRSRSKALLGGWYRAEVARAISELGDDTWTVADVAQRVPDIPTSCVNKELTTLLDCDFVLRNGKNERGQYLYSTSGAPEYWALGRALTETTAPEPRRSVVVQLRPKRRGAPRA